MMDKILIELWVPAAEKSYDVWIPRGSKLYAVRSLLAVAMKELSAGKYFPTEYVAMCDKTGKILNINMTVDELGLKNGSQLMLI